MSNEKITRAMLTDDGVVLIEQPDGTWKKAESQTDWERLNAMSDKDIDYSDIPELDEKFWANAKLRMPENKERITVRIDPDVLAWLKAQGPGYQTRLNAILRTYMEAQQPKP